MVVNFLMFLSRGCFDSFDLHTLEPLMDFTSSLAFLTSDIAKVPFSGCFIFMYYLLGCFFVLFCFLSFFAAPFSSFSIFSFFLTCFDDLPTSFLRKHILSTGAEWSTGAGWGHRGWVTLAPAGMVLRV